MLAYSARIPGGYESVARSKKLNFFCAAASSSFTSLSFDFFASLSELTNRLLMALAVVLGARSTYAFPPGCVRFRELFSVSLFSFTIERGCFFISLANFASPDAHDIK